MAVATMASASQPKTLDGAPWPTQGGKVVNGTSLVRASVAWDGTPLSGCIEQSSGSDALDAAAMRAVAKQHAPSPPGKALPHPFEAHMPVVFNAERPTSETMLLEPLPRQACEPTELPAYAPAMRRRQLEAAHTIVMMLGSDGIVPETTAAWPRDPSGKLLTGEVLITSVVRNGHLDESMMAIDRLGVITEHPQFAVAAARKALNVAVDDPSDSEHIADLHFRFDVPATLDVSRIPIYTNDTPQGKESTRLSACAIVGVLGRIISKDHRAGVSQAEATAKAKDIADGILPRTIETVAATIYEEPVVFGTELDDQLHKRKALFYCLGVLGTPAS